ncbi:CAT RNA binding domain-containing protein [Oceanobacillus sp. CF4.6]|uniref:CAT RNA binding domain-containing protein n=1 Tax=Oceanobacillus sp. CF4.6 TaxID=3373080 RepID=UPI003EE7AD7C
MDTFSVKKVLNNNVLIAMDIKGQEVVLIGKGIGFNTKKNDPIAKETVEKLFALHDEKEQENYKKLLQEIDEETLNAFVSSIEIIKKRSKSILNENVHVALTDHIVFAINRLLKGMAIRNPFLSETKALYPGEYEIA